MRRLSQREFNCRRCGACCRVEGYVTLEEGESERLALFLNLPEAEFIETFTRLKLSRRGLALTEQEDGACIFLRPDGSCRVQPVKPSQCQNFPFSWTTSTLLSTCPALKDLHND